MMLKALVRPPGNHFLFYLAIKELLTSIHTLSLNYDKSKTKKKPNYDIRCFIVVELRKIID